MRKLPFLLALLSLASFAFLAGCGATFKNSTTAPGPTPPAADFSLTVTPSTLTLTGGAAAQTFSVMATGTNGFAASVAITISGLPAGVTASPATLSLTPGTPQSITLAANGSVNASTASVTVTGSSGATTHTAAVALTVNAAAAPPPAGDFSLSVTPSAVTLTGGAAGQSISVLATGTNGFNAPVAVSLTGLPTGVTASPAALTLAPGAAQSITLIASGSAAAGSSILTLTGVSGAITHAVAVALTVNAAPPPPGDFSLSVTPTSQTIVQGAAGSALSVAATGTNGFSANVVVAITGLPSGVTAAPATLTLTPGTPQSVTLTAAANATPGASTVTFTGTSGSLSHAATLALTIQAAAPPPANGPDVTTYHYDNTRQGLNAQETTLTLANVNSTTFGKKNFFTADGKVDAQPLYLNGLSIGGVTTNVLYMASEHDSVYAINASTGATLWKVSVLGAGEVPSDQIGGCTQISPEIGVTSTPVIDRAKGVIYVVAMSKNGNTYHQRLHALSLTTGAELAGSPKDITGSYPGTGANSSNGNVIFDPFRYAERAGLLLLNGQVYLTWTSHCDGGPYTGWVMAYDETTLQQTALINLTPNGSEGSVWMAGYGMAADANGNIYFLDANGTFDGTLDANGFPSSQDYGNAIMKLTTAGGKLAVADYFQPSNTIAESNADIDLGSGGGMLLPDVTDASGNVRHLIVGAGKDNHIYLADRDNLGKYNPANNNNLYQDIPRALPNGAWSGPAYFNHTVYYGGVGDTLKAFPIVSGKLATTPSSRSVQSFAYPGSTPSVSANGTQNGIVWALESAIGSTAVLHAYDATDLSKELYNSNQAANNRDHFGTGNKFITPVVVNGQVFVGTPTGVAAFGPLP